MSTERLKLEGRTRNSQHESLEGSRLNYVPPPPRLRSYTDPTLQSLYYDDTGSTRIIQTAPYNADGDDDQASFIEDSEEEIPIILSSVSTILPKLSSMLFNNNFETSMDTSLMNLNLYHCNESSQLNNDNFNEQDFAMPTELEDIHDYYNSQNIGMDDDTDIILVTSQKQERKQVNEIDEHHHQPQEEPQTREVSPEGEDNDSEFEYEGNITIDDDNDKSESIDKFNVLLTVENLFQLDQVMGSPKEEEILECSTQCDDDEFNDVNKPEKVTMEKSMTDIEPELPSLTKIDNKEKKIESFPGEVKVISQEEVQQSSLVGKESEQEPKEDVDVITENDGYDDKEEQIEKPSQPQSKKTKSKKKKEQKEEKVVLKELKYFNTTKEDIKPKVDTPIAKKQNKITTPVSTSDGVANQFNSQMAPPSSPIMIKKQTSSIVTKKSESKDINTNKENNQAIITKRIKKRIGSKPLSEICNQQPRSRVGLSKRVRIESLHNNMKKRKTT